MEINIVYSTDDNYAVHTGISMISLAENNKSIEKINVYIIENEISKTNKNKIKEISLKYNNINIVFVDFSNLKNSLKLKMKWNISISAYARLFLEELLPEAVDRVLYLDCDTIVNNSLEKIWNIDTSNYFLAAVQDTVSDTVKEAISLNKKDMYYNSGVLLINLNAWREQHLQNQFIEYINKCDGSVFHHDQGVINFVCRNKILRIPLENNFMTIHYFLNRNKLLKYFSEKSNYYSEFEVEYAKNNIVVYHYTPSFTSRPWVTNCKHPYRNEYLKYKNLSSWRKEPMIKDNSKIYLKIINFGYRNLPFTIWDNFIKIILKIKKAYSGD